MLYNSIKKMSAFGTKKPNADFNLQLTFPSVFSEHYDTPLSYYQEAPYQSPFLESSTDLQGDFHRQKMADAKQKVMDAVQSRKNSDYRASISHCGYYKMPKPVLGQRIYANPSFGNQSDIYSNRPDSILYGGVLYTTEAQKFGRDKLKERANQLNAIEQAKVAFLSDRPIETQVSPEAAYTPKLDLVASLQAILSHIVEGKISKFAYDEVVNFLRLLFRWAVTANVDELTEVFDYVSMIEREMLAYPPNTKESGNVRPVTNSHAEQILTTMQKVREYIRKMISIVNRPIAEKKAASSNFMNAIGFTRLTKENPTAEMTRQTMRDEERRTAYKRAQEAGLPPKAFNYQDDLAFETPQMKRRRPRVAPQAKLDKPQREIMTMNRPYLGEEGEQPYESKSMPSAEMKPIQEAPEPEFESPLTIHMPRQGPRITDFIPSKETLKNASREEIVGALRAARAAGVVNTYTPHSNTSVEAIRREVKRRFNLPKK